MILLDILITRLPWRPKVRMPASGFEHNRHVVWPGVTEGLHNTSPFPSKMRAGFAENGDVGLENYP